MKNKKKSLSLKAKLILSLSAIAVSILVSTIVSVIEYSRMSTYVSDLIAEDVKKINTAQNLEEVCSQYNLDILTVIGVDSLTTMPDINPEDYVAQILELPQSDAVLAAYNDYMDTSRELKDEVISDFSNVRSWYFDKLQPKYDALRAAISKMSDDIYADLKTNSEVFDSGFYRSQVPGIVIGGVGLILILLLMYFILVNYVRPLYKILDGLNNFKSHNRKYKFDFDGDDQLKELSDGISELTADNVQLRKRIEALKD